MWYTCENRVIHRACTLLTGGSFGVLDREFRLKIGTKYGAEIF